MKRVNHHPGLRTARAVLGSAALLLPLFAEPESHLQSQASGGAAIRATAHVDFKIIIPRVLYLDVGGTERVAGATGAGGADRVAGAQPVSIMSNSHNVTLATSVRTSDDPHGNLILSAAARKIIAQDAACTLGLARAAAPSAKDQARVPERSGVAERVSATHSTSRILCTASMP